MLQKHRNKAEKFVEILPNIKASDWLTVIFSKYKQKAYDHIAIIKTMVFN